MGECITQCFAQCLGERSTQCLPECLGEPYPQCYPQCFTQSLGERIPECFAHRSTQCMGECFTQCYAQCFTQLLGELSGSVRVSDLELRSFPLRDWVFRASSLDVSRFGGGLSASAPFQIGKECSLNQQSGWRFCGSCLRGGLIERTADNNGRYCRSWVL
jgi:hypothetical protein